MSTARSAGSVHAHRLASSIQFVVSQENHASHGDALEKRIHPCTKLVASTTTLDDLNQSTEFAEWMLESLRISPVDSFVDRSDTLEDFIRIDDVPLADLTFCTHFTWSEPSVPTIDDSSYVCQTPIPSPSIRVDFHQCIWCGEFHHQGNRLPPKVGMHPPVNDGLHAELIISQQVCVKCRVQLIDRIRQSLFD